MTNQDLKTHEFENDIQRFMQIRDQIHAEVKKIGAHASTLDETNKRLVAHFDVFKEITDESEEQISSAIKGAAQEMARISANEFSLIVDDGLRHKLADLAQAIQEATQVLETSRSQKYRKLVLFAFLGCLLSGFVGYVGGYFSTKKTIYELPRDFFETYLLGLSAQLTELENKFKEGEAQRKTLLPTHKRK